MSYLIIGLAKSGYFAAKFLQKNQKSVIIFDDNSEKYSSSEISTILADGAEIFDEDKHLLSIKKVVISPGVALNHFLVKKLKNLNISIISEMELGLCFIKNKTIAVTGTCGKSTVCSLISHVLNCMSIPNACIGNIGYPITKYLMHADDSEILIIEISSFQLESITQKYFDVGLILNIYPHHLDRYDSFDTYAKVKLSLKSKTKKQYVSKKILSQFKSQLKKCNTYEELDWGNTAFFNQNLSAAFTICKELKISKKCFLDAINSFQGLPHRLEKVAVINQVEYFNDSKATNPSAVIQAIERFDKKVILITGGYDSFNDFSVWRKAFPGKIKKIIAIGQCSKKIFDILSDLTEVFLLDDLSAGFKKANQLATRGDVVLFSPGCQSFDQFSNFEERGDAFKQLVIALKERGQ